jgi:outer membrane receptor for ferrienterochelin and colicins
MRAAETEELASIMKLSRSSEGYFMEAHVKLRPVDMASEGVFVCGTAHSPKLITESVSQAMAASARAGAFLSGRWIFGDLQGLSATAYYNLFSRFKDQYNSLLDLWGSSGDETENYLGADLFLNRFLGTNNELTVGLSYAYDQLEKYNIQNAERQTRHTVSVVLQDEQFREDAYSAIAGIRGEYSNDYGFFFTPKLSGMLYIGRDVRILPAVGLGYRAPTFLELYLDSAKEVYHKYGNPDLEPEKSVGFNLGLEWLPENATLRLNAFHNELWDEIAYDYTGTYEGVPPNELEIIIKQNLDRSFRSGADASAELTIAGFLKARLSYGFLYAYDRSEQTVLDDQPAHRGSGRLSVLAEAAGLNGYVELTAQSAYSHRDTAQLLVNLYLAKSIGKALELFAGADNLTGVRDDYSIYLIGPVIYAGLNARFE